MPKYIDLTGKKFGRLTVERLSEHKGTSGELLWECACDCGCKKRVHGANLRFGRTKSCGCLDRDVKTKHGKSRSRAYNSWSQMKYRCERESHVAFREYGERGITVCERWQSFENFLADMGNPPDGHSLDRIDTNGNYEPGNCRWATPKQQVENRRNTVYVQHHGKKQTLVDACKELGLNIHGVRQRLRRGLGVDIALSSADLRKVKRGK